MTTLPFGRFKPAEHYNNYWAAALAAEHSLDDALKPEFWSHVARVFKPGDLVRIIPEKGDFYANVIVLATGRAFAKVKLVDYVPLLPGAEGYEEQDVAEAEAGEPDLLDLEVAYKGPHLKHCVIRKSDKTILKDGISAKVDAEQWMRDHLETMAR